METQHRIENQPLGISENDSHSSKFCFEIPIEVWIIIMSHLNFHSLLFATVSKTFHQHIVYQSISDLSGNFYEIFNEKGKKMDSKDFLAKFPNLKRLDTSQCEIENSLTDVGIRTLKKLSTLIFSGNTDITDEGLIGLLNITHLDLFNEKRITDLSLKTLTNITYLDLYNAKSITDDGVRFLTNLKTLGLAHNPNITDKGISGLLNLTDLDIECNHKITKELVDHLIKNGKLNKVRKFDKYV